MLDTLIGAIYGALMGSLFTLLITIGWDSYKNKQKFHELLLSVLSELNENKNRMNSILDKWPPDLKAQFQKDNKMFVSEEEVKKQFEWSFPKPYITDAWKSFIFSGHVNKMPYATQKKLFRAHDHINSINFLGNLSVEIFKILVTPNKLDPKTNNNFDQFCRAGVQGMEVLGTKILEEAIDSIKSIIPKELLNE